MDVIIPKNTTATIYAAGKFKNIYDAWSQRRQHIIMKTLLNGINMPFPVVLKKKLTIEPSEWPAPSKSLVLSDIVKASLMRLKNY